MRYETSEVGVEAGDSEAGYCGGGERCLSSGSEREGWWKLSWLSRWGNSSLAIKGLSTIRRGSKDKDRAREMDAEGP